MGSVKDLEVLQKPTRDAMGVGRFHFSDRYSVFWKAKALKRIIEV
ncbi:MAG: hypothetical protein ACPLKZ_06540 [Candidatus Bathyarchaeales archaeon]